MLAELRTGSARARSYWAQQLAFGPVMVHALARAVRKGRVSDGDYAELRGVVEMAFACLGALPEGAGVDPVSLRLVARRQAVAVARGRRRVLARLAARLGGRLDESRPGVLPRRLLRAYPLIGWCPPEEGA